MKGRFLKIMKKKNSFNTHNFPKDALRITKSDGTKVWLYKGKEYYSKKELLLDNKLA
jgi:hypothetical protein